jgi:hypothetical protein
VDCKRNAVKQLSSIPGLKGLGVKVVVSENRHQYEADIEPFRAAVKQLSRFPTDGHLVSWAGGLLIVPFTVPLQRIVAVRRAHA